MKKRLSDHPLFKTYRGMLDRCNNLNYPTYYRYGGRGISVCDRWKESFYNFVQDMGEKPSKIYQLDRIDNNGPYSPENCRWATVIQNCSNTRINKFILNETYAEFARKNNVNRSTVRSQMKQGYCNFPKGGRAGDTRSEKARKYFDDLNRNLYSIRYRINLLPLEMR